MSAPKISKVSGLKKHLPPIKNELSSFNGVTAKQILVHNEKYKMICFVFEEGKGLPNHTHNGLAAIQIISGEVDMSFESGESYHLKPGDVLGFDARVMHQVIATKKCQVIVTIIF